ncbi:uncharacterized protein [Palaemon carinicauda]|uniref:uncharacterized protein n=1 Tax=Palaemon carinicauda TaxID=392227 RepID=UPI0035B59807
MDLPSSSSHTPQQPDTVPPSIQIDEFDESSVRLWKIFREAIQPLYFMILCWVNPTWDRGSNFKDYLESQGVNTNEVKRNLSKDQWDKFMNPSSHNTWDISMIHALLPFSKGLAGKNDKKWHKQNGSDPEISLTILKNKRNETAHNPRIERGWCCLIIDELYELTIKMQEGLKLVVLGYVVNPEDKEEIEREMDRVFDNKRQKIHEIGKGDHTIDAYIALLRATEAPLPNREEINIRIILNDTDGLVELQRQLGRHLINPSWIQLHNHHKGDSEPTVEERESIKNLLTNE